MLSEQAAAGCGEHEQTKCGSVHAEPSDDKEKERRCHRGRRSSIWGRLEVRDDLATLSGADAAPDVPVDVLADEAHGAVPKEEVDAPSVIASGRQVAFGEVRTDAIAEA